MEGPGTGRRNNRKPTARTLPHFPAKTATKLGAVVQRENGCPASSRPGFDTLRLHHRSGIVQRQNAGLWIRRRRFNPVSRCQKTPGSRLEANRPAVARQTQVRVLAS